MAMDFGNGHTQHRIINSLNKPGKVCKRWGLGQCIRATDLTSLHPYQSNNSAKSNIDSAGGSSGRAKKSASRAGGGSDAASISSSDDENDGKHGNHRFEAGMPLAEAPANPRDYVGENCWICGKWRKVREAATHPVSPHM